MSHIFEIKEYGVELLPYCSEHDAQTVKWLSDKDLIKKFGFSRTISLDSHRAWLDKNPEVIIWAINKDSRHLGNVLLHVNSNRRSAYLQIYLGEVAERGKGIGWKALSCVLDFGFGHLRLHRIWLHVLPDNHVAAALYAKAGFVREGIERDGLFSEGRFSDQHRWSLIEHEWTTRKLSAKI